MGLRLLVGCLNALSLQPFLSVYKDMPTKTLAELANIRTQLNRLHKRLERLDKHKLPIYWSLQPRVFVIMSTLEGLLKEDENALSECLSKPKE